jgi:GNAT superfamily N-acetyltransferase
MPFQTVRRVLPHEYPKYRAHLKALDTESRTLRFGSPITDHVIDNICDKFESEIDKNILFAVENNDLEFIAIGHIAVNNEMELAFSVLKQHQGKGLGSAVMKRCIQWCRTNKILKGYMVCLSSNSTIKHLCHKHGIKVKTEDGESLADIELDTPNIVTYIAEATDVNLATIDYLGKRMAKPWALTA